MIGPGGLVLFLAPFLIGGGEEELSALLLRLERPAVSARALEDLVARGAPAATRALEGFAEAPTLGRIQRAELVLQVGSGDHLGSVLELLTDAEPKVRRRWVGFLAGATLGTERARERLAALREASLHDPDIAVRRRAIRGLGEADLRGPDGASRVLAELARELAGEEARLAAEALAVRSDGAAQVVELVRAAFRGVGATQALDARVLAALFADYGSSLAESRPGEVGGEGGAPWRVPFLFAGSHPAAEVRAQAGISLEKGLARLQALGLDEDVDAWLAGFESDGLRPQEMIYRRVHQAFEDGRLSDAEGHALRLLAQGGGTPGTPSLEEGAAARIWQFYGSHFLAACHFVRGDFARARGGFVAAAGIIRGLLRERIELRPTLRETRKKRYPSAPFVGALAADRWQLLALEEMWIATTLLAESGESAAPEAALHARSSHIAQLNAQLVATKSDAGIGGRNWDELLDRDLGPRRLVLQRPDLEGWGGTRSLELSVLLARALATVSEREMPGFLPFEVAGNKASVGDIFADQERFQLLLAIEEEDLVSANRDYTDFLAEARNSDLDPAEQRSHPKYIRYRRLVFVQRERAGRTGHDDPALRAEVYRELIEYRQPSEFALTLSADMRIEGENEQAETLSRAMLAALEAGVAGLGSVQAAMTTARLELSISSSLMDSDQPREAEERGLAAVRRLEELEKSLVERAKGASEEGGVRAWYQGALATTRTMLSNALLSLAVNSNVRLEDPERALAFFERAYKLDQSDFMRMLLACYRARSGHDEEARAVLGTLTPAPQLYYNLACTHALLGDTDLALDYLGREFAENHRTPGSLTRQKEWARGDPDLASLRGHPLFQRLTAE